jgi:DNA-binding LytR/AlgR family response regulator
MKTHCIIVDDEPLARKAMASLLSRFDDLEVVADCENTFKAMKVLQEKRVDLMFLDIQMPEVSGLEFLRALKNPPAVILTTAHREYALEGYELDVIDYLLKPVSFERLMKAINKYYDLYQVKASSGTFEEGEKKGFITIRADRKNIRINVSDILWVRSLKDYVQIYATDQKYITQLTLGEIETMLPEQLFLRIHRSYIINLSRVTAFTGQDVEINEMEIPIGGSFKNLVISKLKQQKNK